jgi:hypothetical protein
VTAEDAFFALAAGIGANFPRAAYFSEADLKGWPKPAVAALKAQKLLVQARAATSTICPGCEQQCAMPVNVPSDGRGRPDAFVVCDKRADIGRVPIAAERLRQWRSDEEALCRFIADRLGVRRSSTASPVPGLLNIGIARGSRRTQMVALRPSGEPSIVVAESMLPVSDVIVFERGSFGLDLEAIVRLVDAASTADERHTRTTARRDARKLDTQQLHEQWQRAYRKLRREHPGESDTWYSRKIAKSEAGKRHAAETIRKHMTK